MKKYILGNWKMNGSNAFAAQLAGKLAAYAAPTHTEVVLFPPFTALGIVAQKLMQTPLLLGAQDCSPEADGAFTGDISASLLKDAGCKYVIVGHSERRTLHKETDALIKRKAEAALTAGLTPVICVGESLQERESGKYLESITSQLKNSLPTSKTGTLLIAYEPVWAIGSGKTPTVPEISEVHKTIATVLSYAKSGAHTAIAYGGSVKAANAKEILSAEGVDGVLVGGASLKAEEFCAIIKAAH